MLRRFLSDSTKARHPRVYAVLRKGYRAYAETLLRARRVDAGARLLPSFLIIGAQKAGTTSLYQYLTQQPDILPAFRKEIHYFSYLYGHRSDRWYRAFFPRAPRGSAAITGEASTYYHMCLRAPERAARLVPDARIVFIVRDPVERAFSHYKHSVRKGFEERSLEEALEREQAELPAELERLRADDSYESYLHQHQAYLARGCYMDQLERWLHWFDRDRVMVLRAEDLFAAPEPTYAEVLTFLGVEQTRKVTFDPHNWFASRQMMDPALRKRIARFYEPHNERLAAWLGRDLGWSTAG